MRAMEIYRNGTLAGRLTEENRQHFVFRYDENYFNDANKTSNKFNATKNTKGIQQ